MNKLLLLLICFLIGIFLYVLLKKSCRCRVVEGQITNGGSLTITIPQIKYNRSYTPRGMTQYNGDPIEFNLRLLTLYDPIDDFNIYLLTPTNPVMVDVYDPNSVTPIQQQIFDNNPLVSPLLLYVHTDGSIYIRLPFTDYGIALTATLQGNNLILDPIALNIYGNIRIPPSIDPRIVPPVITMYVILDTINRYVLLTRASELEIDTLDPGGNRLSLEEIKTLVDLATLYIEKYGKEEGIRIFNQDYTPGYDIELLSLRLRSLTCQQFRGGGSDAVSRRI